MVRVIQEVPNFNVTLTYFDFLLALCEILPASKLSGGRGALELPTSPERAFSPGELLP